MSASDDRVDVAHAHGPYEFTQGVTLTRRQALQATAAAIVAGAASGTVAAEDDDEWEDWSEDVPNTMYMGSSISGTADPSQKPKNSSAPGAADSPDETQMHTLSRSAREWSDHHNAIMSNHVEDMGMVAHNYTRHEIASAWEDGDSSSTAYSRAMDATREYFAHHQANHIETGLAMPLIEASHNAWLATQDGDIDDQHWVAFSVPDHYARVNAREYDRAALEDEEEEHGNDVEGGAPGFVETTIELIDGTEHETRLPLLEVYETQDDFLNDEEPIYSEPLSTDVIDSYDPNAEQNEDFTLEEDLDGEGTDLTTSLAFTVPNVGDVEDGGLPSFTMFDGREWMEVYSRIEDVSDHVTANYDQSIVDALYDAMDEGELTPSQVRGPAGMAYLLSGTSDATTSNYRAGLLHQLGLEHADMSNVASIEIEYTGYTTSGRKPIGDGRSVMYFEDHEEATTLEGQIFTDGLDSPVKTGNAYYCGARAYTADRNGVLYAVRPGDQTLETSLPLEDFDIAEVFEATEDGKTVFVADWGGNVAAVDTGSFEVVWRDEFGSDRVMSMALTNDESVLYIGTEEAGLYHVDPEDGSQISHDSSLNDRVQALDVCSQTDRIAVGHGGTGSTNDQYITVFDSDWNEEWEDSIDRSTTPTVGFTPDGEKVAVSFQNNDILHVYDTESGDLEWDDNSFDIAYGFAFDADSETLYAANRDTTVVAYDLETGDVIWSITDEELDNGERPLSGIEWSPDNKSLLVTDETSYLSSEHGEMYSIDPETGQIEWQLPVSEDPEDEDIRGVQVPTASVDYDGYLTRAVFLDFPSAEEYQLRGWFEVVSITDAEGNELEEIDPDDWGEPEYDSTDTEQYVKYVERTETYQETIYVESDDDGDSDGEGGWGIGMPSFGWGTDNFGSNLLGLGIIGVAIVMVVSFVTDLLPWT
ncbi:PQQ-binding-like beta-propeller repeat protein [Natrialbaceae archaeon A-CW3]